MTDNEIIKALEICTSEHLGCEDGCPYRMGDCLDDGYRSVPMKDALDLINRQKAEIERLQKLQKPTETSGFKIENGKVIFYTNILKGYRHEYKDLKEVVDEMNLMLQNAYKNQDISSFYTGKLKEKQAEIERLSDRNRKCIYLSDDETTEYCVDSICPKFKTEEQIKSEAIKELWISIKSKRILAEVGGKLTYVVPAFDFDNLVKEMTAKGGVQE